MKKARKEELLCGFPAIPDEIMEQMKGKGAENFAVMLTWGRELFVRCYHRYSNGKIAERQRYVFADDGAVRYGSDDSKHWTVRKNFREPVFCKSGYGYSFDNRYNILNRKVLAESCMKYSQLDKYKDTFCMEYLHFYCKHRNLEYIMKSGFDVVLGRTYGGFWNNQASFYVESCINWKTNNLLKMLGLTKTEFKRLQGNQEYYLSYLIWRGTFPTYQPEELLTLCRVFGNEHGTLERFCRTTGLKPRRIAAYLEQNKITSHDYNDYLDQCQKLKYDLHDTAINMPHHFWEMHTRLTKIIKYKADETHRRQFAEHMLERRKLEFRSGNLVICQPDSMDKIIAEGKSLCHCVAGYAERHAEGKLHILFIRQKESMETPFYTMEVSREGKIVQVRGERNRDPTPEVAELIEEYKKYLEIISIKSERSMLNVGK
ncbi:MAG: PcfJ domain-containing protein [Oscillospiraceae bacterium]|nr:PcfJ domain-containing protein [Oscillospiraceae bacterium]